MDAACQLQQQEGQNRLWNGHLISLENSQCETVTSADFWILHITKSNLTLSLSVLSFTAYIPMLGSCRTLKKVFYFILLCSYHKYLQHLCCALTGYCGDWGFTIDILNSHLILHINLPNLLHIIGTALSVETTAENVL